VSERAAVTGPRQPSLYRPVRQRPPPFDNRKEYATMSKHDHKKQAQEFLVEAMYAMDQAHPEFVTKLEEMLDDDLVIQWNKFDERNPATWPRDSHGRNQVLAFSVWSKGPHHRYGSMACGDVKKETREARFFEAFYGRYDIAKIDGEQKVVFFLDHGNEDEDDTDDWVEPPPFWTYIADPQRLEIE